MTILGNVTRDGVVVELKYLEPINTLRITQDGVTIHDEVLPEGDPLQTLVPALNNINIYLGGVYLPKQVNLITQVTLKKLPDDTIVATL